ncbi:MAG TPA: chloride channel protein, partial [Polyangiales bacterium]
MPTPPKPTSGWPSELSARLLAFSLGLVPKERHRLFALTILLGGVCGLIAVMFHSMIRAAEHFMIDRSLDANGMRFVLCTLLIPTCGALLSGVLLYFFFPRARGSGIPEVKFVYAAKSGRLRLRDSTAKFFISALQIGSGSSLGREGPTVQI